MLQTITIMGPTRFGVPFTQALTAPLLGSLQARGRSAFQQVLACAVIRLVQTAVFVAFFALVIAGGLDSYTDTYNSLARHVPLLPEGTEAALVATLAGLLFWAVFASTVQVLVYRRGLRLWPDRAGESQMQAHAESPVYARRFDARAIAVASAVAFCLLIASTAWLLLAGVAAWLALAWATARGDRDVVPAGVVLAGVIALGVLVFVLVGGSGVDLALRRAARVALLVLVATWLRAAAGTPGLREVARRVLGRLRGVPSAREAALLLEDLGSGRELGRAGRSALFAIRQVPKRPIPVLDAVLGWVAAESARFRAVPASGVVRLYARGRDYALVLLAAAPGLALLA